MSSTLPGKISKKETFWAAALLAAIALALAFSISLLPRLQSHYSISQFLPPNHPLLKADLETRGRFFLDEAQPVLVTLDLGAAPGDWLNLDRLKRLGEAAESFNNHEGIKATLSLASVQTAKQSDTEVSVGRLTEIKSEAERRNRVTRDRFLTPLLISNDLRRTLVVVSVEPRQPVAVINATVERLHKAFAKALPEARVSIGGVPAIQSRLTSLVKSELTHFMALALLASCLTLLLVFSSVWSALIPFISILFANIFVLGFMAWAGISMTVLAVTTPILVSITVLSLCVHTMLRFVEDAHKSHANHAMSPKAALVLKTLRELLLPNLLTSLTTCFGFATLLLTDVPVIRDFGVAVSASVLISWLSTTLVLVPLLALLPLPVARRWVLAEASWVKFVFRHRRAVVSSVIALCVSMTYFGRELHWSARIFDDLPNREEARRATESIDQNLGGTIPFEVLIERGGVREPWNDPKAVVRLDKVLAKIRKHLEVGSAVGLPELLRQALGNPRAKIPAQRSAIAESWFLLSMSAESPLKQFLTSDGTTARIALRLRDLPSDRLQVAMRDIVNEVGLAFPGSRVSTAGLATTIHTLNNEVSKSLINGFWQALGVITLLLFAVFRSWRWTLTAVLPNLVPAAVLVGVLALTKTPIKPGVALVFSIALGIAFNNTVYLLQRLRVLTQASGKPAGYQVEKMLRLEGNPCLVSSVCVLTGFAIFLFSDFEINKTFGTYMLISLFFGLIGDLVFMPALIRLFPAILGSTAKPGEANLDIQDKEFDDMTNTPNSTPTGTPNEKTYVPRAAAGLAILLSAVFAGQSVAAATDANAILKNVQAHITSKDEAAKIKMKVVESNGTAKDREILIKRKSGDKQQVLVRLKAPADVSGIALLTVSSGGADDQWIYMPSQKKARRVVSGNKSQKFLDTEFNLEDFSANTYAHFTNKVVKEERAPSSAMAVIESDAKDKASSYSKIMTWVDTGTYQIQKSEYYDREGKLLKTMVFRDYKKYGAVWRAQTIEVRNMQNKRSTVLEIAALKVNMGLADREFTQSALEDHD